MSSTVASLRPPAIPVRPPSLAPATAASQAKASRSTQRFTLDGETRLERFMRNVCHEVADGVRKIIPARKLQGVILAGSYGCGEGSILLMEEGQVPNDVMEFFVSVHGVPKVNDRLYSRPLESLATTLSAQTGATISIRLLFVEALRNVPVSVATHDLVAGHRCVIGDDSLFAGCGYHRDASNLSLNEALHEFVNCCSSLLMAAGRLAHKEFTDEDAEYVGHHHATVQLGIGDAILAACGAHHWSCMERHERLRQMHGGHAAGMSRRNHACTEAFTRLLMDPIRGLRLLGAHEAGLVFKVHPRQSHHSRKVLVNQHVELSKLAREVWRILEAGKNQPASEEPTGKTGLLEINDEESASWKNTVRNARLFGWRGLFNAKARRPAWEHIAPALFTMLWGDLGNPAVLSQLKGTLHARSTEFIDLAQAYETLWLECH